GKGVLSFELGADGSGGKHLYQDEYVYVILPGKNQEETSTFAKEMDVSILSNTPTQQVIYDDADDIFSD
ncbi:hypothetical protein ACT453_54880, partial [Bacillus sp. D-CC]